ncbi:hypothetical protein CTI12_AA012310 [Artemisia annua]|uniref:Uncharacterized protein n=1 Tax=Artemisia annua TaxID=35608 RepID=A0A2U1PU07_ARTAN|nr:hypothetical protein CTI12_AA012310 [Artemisia annua]
MMQVNYLLESLFHHLAYNRIEVQSWELQFSGVAVIRFTNKDCKKAKHIAKRKLLCKSIMEEEVGKVDWQLGKLILIYL